MVPPDATVGAAIAHLEAVGVCKRGQGVGHRSGGGLIAGGGGVPVKRLRRPLIGARFTEVSERPRLCAPVGRGRAGGVGVQGARPPLVAAIRWRCAGCDARRYDAQAHPPRRPRGEPGQGVGGTGHAMIGAEALGPAACSAYACEPGCGLRDARRSQGLAAEPKAAGALGEGQGLARAAVTGPAGSCAVGAPALMGDAKRADGCARRPKGSALTRLGPSPMAAEDSTDGRACRPGPAGLACAEARHPLLGPPGRRPWSGVKERRHPRVRRVAGRRAGPTGALFEALWAVGAIAVKPCVPGLAADAVKPPALGDGETVTPIISDARRVLVHRRCVTPRPGAPPSRVPTSLVKLSPLSLDKTVTDVSGPYRCRFSRRSHIESHILIWC